MAAVPSIGRATRVERSDVRGAAAAGDLYERYSGQIFGYCLNQLGSREEAEDAVQTTFMNAFRGLQRGIVPELESAWLFKIAHNVCLSRRRSSWRRGRVETPNNFEVLQEIVPGRDHVADELIRLQDVLEEMPENQRRAILLREWQGLTYREISTELGLSQAAVETLIFRARRALAQGLEQDADTWKKRLRRGADVGGVVACVKTLLTGGGAAAIKIGTTAVLVAGAAVAATTAPSSHKHPTPRHAPVAKVSNVAPPVVRHTTPAIAPRVVVADSSRSRRVAKVHPAVSSSRPHASAVTHAPPPALAPPAMSDPDDSVATPAPAPDPATQVAPAAETQAVETIPQSEAEIPGPVDPAPPAVDDHPAKTKPDHPDHPDHPDVGHGKDK